MVKIFISHAHDDAELVKALAQKLSDVFSISLGEIFYTSDPNAIQSGDWFDTIRKSLDAADTFIPVFTPCSVKSVWVAFECGYFYAKKGQDHIHPLKHPKTDIRSHPLQHLQAKLLTNEADLKVFFKNLPKPLNGALDFKSILDQADKTPMVTSEERKNQQWGKLQLIQATSPSAKQVIVDWMKAENILHDAKLDWIGDLRGVTFTSGNMKRTDLGGNYLQNVNFWEADLENAILGSTHLQGANFHYAVLRGASFQGAQLDETTTLPDGEKYIPSQGLGQLTRFEAVIDR